MRASPRPPAAQPARARPATAEPPPRPAAVQLRARRSTRLIIIGVLCACLGGLAMAWAWSGTQESRTVVLMAKAVARGDLVESTDLTTTTIGRASGVAVVPAAELPGLVGQFARVDLPAGSLVGPDSVGARVVPAGSAHVGLRLAAGRLPSGPLPAGAFVSLVAVPAPMDAERGPGAQFEAVVVSAPTVTSDGGSWLLDVQVEQGSAAAVAALAASDRISVIRKADG